MVAKWLGHSPKVAAQHSLMSRDHHFEDAVGGSGGPVRPEFRREKTNVKSNAVATRDPTPQVTAGVCGDSHETTDPAATIEVAAGFEEIGVREAGGRAKKQPARGHGWPGGRKVGQEAPKKTARRGHGWPGGRKVAGTGFDTWRGLPLEMPVRILATG